MRGELDQRTIPEMDLTESGLLERGQHGEMPILCQGSVAGSDPRKRSINHDRNCDLDAAIFRLDKSNAVRTNVGVYDVVCLGLQVVVFV